MRKMGFVLAVGLILALMAGVAFAASDEKNLTVNAQVDARAKLTLGASTINFPDADPDEVPSISASQNPVTVTAKVRTGSNSLATLEHQATGDLKSGDDVISISKVTWTATGTGYVPGTMDKTTKQLAGSWVGPGSRNGTFSYFLANSWDYATGNYTVTTTYTLTAP